MAEGLRDEVAMSIDTPCLLRFGDLVSFRATNRGMAKKLPGFLFSGYRNIAFYGDMLVSME